MSFGVGLEVLCCEGWSGKPPYCDVIPSLMCHLPTATESPETRISCETCTPFSS